jgi:lysophospholipase L1-like esterase
MIISRTLRWAMLIFIAMSQPAAAQDSATAAKPFTLFLAGDSTMATQAIVPATPGRGWGQMLQPYFQDHVRVENFGASGRSSKSFRDEGRWQQILDRIQPGDYVLIQFGHNDSKPDPERHTEPFGSYQENLERFVQDVRERQGTPILATSIVRNVFNNDGKTLRDTHGDYVVAARKAAEEQQTPLLDLTRKTGELLEKLGPERSKRLFNNVEPGEFEAFPDGYKDGTHLNAMGACRVCDLAIEEILAKVPELAKSVRQSQRTGRKR